MNHRNDAHVLFVPSHAPEKGTNLSPIGLERLQRALRLKQTTGAYTHFLVSGGRSRDYETVDEAVVMRDWLIANGIAPSCIVVESTSTDSFESVRESFWALSKVQLHFNSDITIVSGRWHGLRLKLSFRAFNVEADRQIVRNGDEGWAGEILKVLWTRFDPQGKAWHVLRDALRLIRELGVLRTH